MTFEQLGDEPRQTPVNHVERGDVDIDWDVVSGCDIPQGGRRRT